MTLMAAFGIRNLGPPFTDVGGWGYGSRCEDCVCISVYDHSSAIRGVSAPSQAAAATQNGRAVAGYHSILITLVRMVLHSFFAGEY